MIAVHAAAAAARLGNISEEDIERVDDLQRGETIREDRSMKNNMETQERSLPPSR